VVMLSPNIISSTSQKSCGLQWTADSLQSAVSSGAFVAHPFIYSCSWVVPNCGETMALNLHAMDCF